MTDKIRNEFAAYGLEILMRSVLLVLYEENLGEKLQPGEIRERLGIPRPEKSYGNLNDLTHGVLKHLQHEDLADHTVDIGWAITTDGIKFIEG